MKTQSAFLKATNSSEENQGLWYTKKPITKNQTTKPSLANSKSEKRLNTFESQEIQNSLFRLKSHTEKSSDRKLPTPNPLSSFGNKAKYGFNGDQKNLKGGGKTGQMSQIFLDTIQVAKNHGINLKPDTPNKAQGNCLFESIVDNVNNRSASFPHKLDEDVDIHRLLWVTELEKKYKETPHYPGYNGNIITEAQKYEWEAAWNEQKQPFQYNVDAFNVSDLTPAGLGHCINKNILVFSNDPYYPVKVYFANHFDKDRAIDTETPVILAHDSENPHYESLLPKGKTDIPKCIELVKSIQNNTYDKSNAMDYWKKAQNAKKREADRLRNANMDDNA